MSLGFDSGEERKKALQEIKKRRAEASLRDDTLLKMDEFRKFLSELADKSLYLAVQSVDVEDWQRGYQDALRDIVNEFVTRSTLGSKWLAEYAAAKAEKNNQEPTEEKA